MARDPLAAGKSFARGCDMNLPAACESLGQLAVSGGRTAFQGSCDHGDGLSCFILGWMMDKGLGVAADPVRAVALFQRSCSNGWARGCGVLAECYRKGEGTAPDLGAAIVNYEKACRGGHAVSCAHVAMMYGRGIGGPPDRARASERLHDACQLGMQSACAPGDTPPVTIPVSSPEASGRSGS